MRLELHRRLVILVRSLSALGVLRQSPSAGA